MKITLLSLFTAVCISGGAQTWNYIGSSTGIANATETDLEVSSNGTLFVAYTDSDNSGKVTVKKWSATQQAWQLVGTAGIGDAGVSGLQLQVLSNDYPVFAAKTMFSGQEFVEIYKFNGTNWMYQPIGEGGYNRVDHVDGFSLATYNLNTYLTFYNSYEQETGYSDLGLITVSLDNFSVISPSAPDLENTNYGYNASLLADNGNFYVVHDESDMGSWTNLDVSTGGGTYNTYQLDDSYAADELKIQKGLFSSYYHAVWSREGGTTSMYYRCFNGTTFGTPATISATSVTEFDSDAYNDQANVFYRAGSTCYFKTITGSASPTVTTISSGIALAPATATSLRTENGSYINVIAYVNSGKVYVKELDAPANIEDYDLLSMCEGTSFNNGNDPAVYLLDDNYSHSNLSITASSQNTAVIPNSAITVPDAGTLNYRISISNTNDVTAQTTVDLLITLLENGTPAGTLNLPVTVNADPTISFNFPSTDFCENDNPVFLANKAAPPGGTWTGNGVVNNTFDPSLLGNSSSATTTLTYTKTSAYGCTASQPVTLTVNSSPALNVTTIPADCNENNGAASVSITEGASPYTIYWSNGSTTPLVNNVAAGQYFLVVTDDNGCRSTKAINIATNGITQSAQTTNVLCYGNSTGAIDLTVSGANGPFTYAWSNGAATQDISGLPAGQYDVSISDASGCTSAGSYTVAQASQLVLSSSVSTASTCGNDDGEIDVTLTGGTTPLQLQWSDESGTLGGETASTLSGYPAGAYDLQITDNNSCTSIMHFSISDLEGPVVAIDTIIDASCASDGEIHINNVAGNASDFQWSNGATTADISGLTAGVYVLEATSGNGCVSFLNAQVPATPPVSVSICLVSVDTSTNTNLVVWEKPVTNGIDHFNIYRETSIAGQYQLIASQDYSIESNYTDLVASPSVRSWRYKISSVDQCGTESELSDYHKTIHLTINQGLGGQYNLSWDQYEGFSYSQFDIWRHTLANGWENIQSMPTNLFTYTDTPPTTDELYYLVTIQYPGTCTSTKANDFNSSRSNKDARYAGLTTTGLSEYIMGTTQVYPNPSTGEFEISNNTEMELNARVVDATGRIIAGFAVPDGLSHHALNNLESGVYQVVLYTGDSRAIHKLSIRH